jgi:HPt (histidine-containing phosphotransfer) domain-containing protein
MPEFSPIPFDGNPPSKEEVRTAALATLGDDESLLEMLMPHFCEAAASQAEQVIEAAKAADAPQLRHWAHTLKGTLLTVGAGPSSSLAARIELAAREGRTEGATELATRLAAEVAVLADFLRPS